MQGEIKQKVICFNFFKSTNHITEVFGSTGLGNNGFSGVMDILAIPKLKFYIENVHSSGFPGITDKMAIPTDPLLPKTSV